MAIGEKEKGKKAEEDDSSDEFGSSSSDEDPSAKVVRERELKKQLAK